MKNIIQLAILMTLSFNAFATNAPRACYKKAAKAVEAKTINSHYDQDGYETEGERQQNRC